MKIETVDGKVLDTAKMSDKNAEIHECIENLYNLCKLYNVPLFCKAILPDSVLGAFHGGTDKEKNTQMMFFLLDDFIQKSTNGAARIQIDESNEDLTG